MLGRIGNVGMAAIFGCKTYDDNETPGFTPNTGVPQSPEVSAGIIFGSSGSSPPAGYYAFRFAMFLWKEIRSGISDMFQQAWIGVFKRQMRDRALHARNQSDNWRFLGVVKIRNYHLFEL